VPCTAELKNNITDIVQRINPAIAKGLPFKLFFFMETKLSLAKYKPAIANKIENGTNKETIPMIKHHIADLHMTILHFFSALGDVPQRDTLLKNTI
jgi:hypothetical protein